MGSNEDWCWVSTDVIDRWDVVRSGIWTAIAPFEVRVESIQGVHTIEWLHSPVSLIAAPGCSSAIEHMYCKQEVLPSIPHFYKIHLKPSTCPPKCSLLHDVIRPLSHLQEHVSLPPTYQMLHSNKWAASYRSRWWNQVHIQTRARLNSSESTGICYVL